MKHVFFLLAILYSTATFACRCAERPFIDDEQYESYDGIVVGKILDVTIKDDQIIHTVQVTKVYKGNFKPEVMTVISGTHSCGLQLQKGKTYLIYGSGSFNELFTHQCTRTKQLLQSYGGMTETAIADYKAKLKVEIDFLEQKLH